MKEGRNNNINPSHIRYKLEDKEHEKAEVIKGNGIRAKIKEKEFAIGNRKLMATEGIVIWDVVDDYAIKNYKQRVTA
ncbi:hypothetical protein [Filibacter tadaridae]|uniref:hypothetical protein n=1 Tax=Filibacter tadaridae TaxID=2483811 RepID=UPI000F5447B7|nr:hypothetical protein [Filibacter tadaridae]